MHPVLRYHDGYEATSPELRDEVKTLQGLLATRGFDVEVDGFFGNGTQGAVEDFQRAHGLEDDGTFFCCDHCAEEAGVTGLRDRM